jgi:hypothetical protein
MPIRAGATQYAVDVADVDGVRGVGGEVASEQVGHRGVGLGGDGGAHAAASSVARDAVLAHDPPDPLVVDPLPGWGAVVELGGDPRSPARAVAVVHGADPPRQRGVRGGARSPEWGCQPGVERGTSHVEQICSPPGIIDAVESSGAPSSAAPPSPP